MMETEKTCGNCLFLITDDGEPYYCAIRDLYTTRESKDKGCEDWRAKDGSSEKKNEV